MAGCLTLCATPIGNLADMSERAVNALREADLIAAEDTRNSIKLLNHFDIHTPMTSYHEYNKYDKAKELVALLHQGKNITLISDAGTPAISDPGEVLARMCHEEGISVTAIPGPAACIMALAMSGMNSRRFCFEGFLPSDNKQRKELLEELRVEKRTMILYEAPHHLKKTLISLKEVLGEERRMTLARELTKKHEEIFVTSIGECLLRYETEEPKGECVLVIEGRPKNEIEEEKRAAFEGMSIDEHMQQYIEQGIDKKEAMKKVAKDLGISKREVYSRLLK